MTDTRPGVPHKLQRDDDVEGFSCGVPELDTWLRKYAYENLRANNAITYVTVDQQRVVGYYAIAMGAVDRDNAPSRLVTGGRPAQTACVLLARLAVDRSMQGRGIGAGLLRDAMTRAAVLSESVGAAAVLVHARDDGARRFYSSQGDFLASPVEPLHLIAPMKDIRKIFLS